MTAVTCTVNDTHDPVYFRADKPFFGMGFKCRNMGTTTANKGESVVFYFAGVTATPDPYVHVRVQVASGTGLQRVAGTIWGADIAPSGTGLIATFARFQSILATGTITAGDWLCLSGVRAGAVKTTVAAEKKAFAIAKSAHAGRASWIEALVLPWRI